MRSAARRVIVDFAELSDPGLDPDKQVNEDASAYLASEHGHLAVVCDGMGGHMGGREASQLAVRTILEYVQGAAPTAVARDLLDGAIQAAGLAVHGLGAHLPAEGRPGSTCVATLVTEAGVLVAHVGDSRALLVRAGGVYPLTRDHSVVQQLVDAGLLSPTEAATHPDANRITRALGSTPRVEVEVAPRYRPLMPGDVLCLITDGVSDLVPAAELRDIVGARIRMGPAIVCQEVIQLVNDRGAHDNATIMVLHVVEIPAHSPAKTLDYDAGAEHGGTQLLTTAAWNQTTQHGGEPHPMGGGLGQPWGGTASEPDSKPAPVPPTLTPPRSPTTSLLTGLYVALSIAGLIALTAALAWWVRTMRQADEAPQPLPVSSTPRIAASTAHLEPDPEPAPPDFATGSALPPPGASAPLRPPTDTHPPRPASSTPPPTPSHR